MGRLIKFIRANESGSVLDGKILSQHVLSGEAVLLGVIWSKGQKRSCYRLHFDGGTIYASVEQPIDETRHKPSRFHRRRILDTPPRPGLQ